MIPEACIGLAILACVIAGAYMLTRPKGPVSIEKSTGSGTIALKIRANRDIRRLEVSSGDIGSEIRLMRRNLKSAEATTFNFPFSQLPVRITVEDDAGMHEFQA